MVTNQVKDLEVGLSIVHAVLDGRGATDSLGENGRARLLPSHFRVKLGGILALPLLLEAIQKRKLDTLLGSHRAFGLWGGM